MQTGHVKTQINKYIDWWLTGLAGLLPNSMSRKICHIPDRLIIETTADEFRCRLYQDNNTVSSQEWLLYRSGEISAIPSDKLPLKPDTQIILNLPHDSVLVKQVFLPQGAAGNLREILYFELERQTPFPADKVCFDWRNVIIDPVNQKLHLELFIIPRNLFDPILVQLNQWQLQPHVATIESVSEINLLSDIQRSKDTNWQNKRTLLLAMLMLFTAATALYLPLLRHAPLLSKAESMVAELQTQASEIERLVKERDNLIARTHFLNEVQNNHIPAILILDELSRRLPDNTWLERMTLNNNELQIFGESDMASSLIQLLDDSGYFVDVRFQAPVTRGEGNGKDRFHIALNLSKVQH